MKILHDTDNIIKNINAIESKETSGLEGGQAFWGRIVAIEDEMLDIKTKMGDIKAKISGENINLPLNKSLLFKVVDSTKDTIVIKAMQQDIKISIPGEEIYMGLLDSLGIEPSTANVEFLKNGRFSFGKNIERLMFALLMDNHENRAADIRNIVIKPAGLIEYLKGFENGEGFLSIISGIIKAARGDISSSGFYEVLAANVLKGLYIQINHSFPLFFIPVPMYFENQPHHGEIWIEKGLKGIDSDGAVYIHVLMDNPYFGRIEGDIRNLKNELMLDLYCRKDIIPLFEKHLNDLSKSISSLGYHIMGLNMHELIKPRDFTDFAKKYVKPFVPVDIKV